MAPPGGRFRVHPRAGGGNPPAARNCGVQARVHPRAGGGTITKCLQAPAQERSIPRAGGGTNGWIAKGTCTKGSIPRAGGGTPDKAASTLEKARSIPARAGGNRHGGRRRTVRRGSIPARAGEPGESPRRTSRSAVHPRAGGGNRGHPAISTHGRPWVHPRAGGGTVIMADIEPGGEGPSPRGRGNRALAPGRSRRQGSIPARAGEPQWAKVGQALRIWGPSPRGRGNRRPDHATGRVGPRVHPRAGGGTSLHRLPAANGGGSIPALGGAGEPSTSSFRLVVDAGPCPARAGEPPRSSRRALSRPRRVHSLRAGAMGWYTFLCGRMTRVPDWGYRRGSVA